MAHERLSLDQEHDGTLAPGQAMTDIETALRTRIEEWNAHILGPGLTQWGIDDLAFTLAAVVQGMLLDALENVEPFISREGTKMIGPITQARVDLFWKTLAALRATPEARG